MEKKVAEENLEAAKELAAELGAGKVELSIKVGEGGRTFGFSIQQGKLQKL